MEIQEAEELAFELLKKHNVEGYSFSMMVYRKKFRRAGQCNWVTKHIQLQPRFVELNSREVVEQTLLHEIAHALRPKHGHNKYWKQTALSIGCDAKRCFDVGEVVTK